MKLLVIQAPLLYVFQPESAICDINDSAVPRMCRDSSYVAIDSVMDVLTVWEVLHGCHHVWPHNLRACVPSIAFI